MRKISPQDVKDVWLLLFLAATVSFYLFLFYHDPVLIGSFTAILAAFIGLTLTPIWVPALWNKYIATQEEE